MTTAEKLEYAAKQLDRVSSLCYVALNPEMTREQVIGIVKRIHRRALALEIIEEDEAYDAARK